MVSIPRAEYARRRKSLMEQMEPNSIAILPAAPVYIRNRDVEHVYRQDSDFQYLTGFPEPEAVMVLIPGREHGEYVLFCRERDPERELWDGLRAGQDGAVAQYGADDAFPIGDIDDILPGLIEGRERVYYAIGTNEKFDHRLMEWINVIRSKARQGATPPNEFVALDHLLHDMRLYKSAAEVKVMKEAAEISAAAHVRAMQTARPGLSEYHLEDELEAGGFFYPPEKKRSMSQNIRVMLGRAAFTEQEVATFRGMIHALSKGRGRVLAKLAAERAAKEAKDQS